MVYQNKMVRATMDASNNANVGCTRCNLSSPSRRTDATAGLDGQLILADRRELTGDDAVKTSKDGRPSGHLVSEFKAAPLMMKVRRTRCSGRSEGRG